mmetsp:Transcript_15749/g.63436  ORF Transcript_15749/g.63436 Transcript_15749/m.63436 type:complete len:280 (+) Transcript_15749:165-1004(+)
MDCQARVRRGARLVRNGVHATLARVLRAGARARGGPRARPGVRRAPPVVSGRDLPGVRADAARLADDCRRDGARRSDQPAPVGLGDGQGVRVLRGIRRPLAALHRVLHARARHRDARLLRRHGPLPLLRQSILLGVVRRRRAPRATRPRLDLLALRRRHRGEHPVARDARARLRSVPPEEEEAPPGLRLGPVVEEDQGSMREATHPSSELLRHSSYRFAPHDTRRLFFVSGSPLLHSAPTFLSGGHSSLRVLPRIVACDVGSTRDRAAGRRRRRPDRAL